MFNVQCSMYIQLSLKFLQIVSLSHFPPSLSLLHLNFWNFSYSFFSPPVLVQLVLFSSSLMWRSCSLTVLRAFPFPIFSSGFIFTICDIRYRGYVVMSDMIFTTTNIKKTGKGDTMMSYMIFTCPSANCWNSLPPKWTLAAGM